MKTKKLTTCILTAVCIGLFAASPLVAEEENSVLKRVQRIDNAELAELIRMTKENYPSISTKGLNNDTERYRINHENSIGLANAIRTVTETYAQIKLLDKKILIIDQKIEDAGQKEIETELLLAKTTLETERFSRIAELREAVNITPYYRFWPKDNKDLNAWIHLEVLDDTIRLINLKKPFYSISTPRGFIKETLRSYIKETLLIADKKKNIQYIKTYINKVSIWPIRIGIVSTEKGKMLADDLEAGIRTVIKDAHAEYDIEIVRYEFNLGDVGTIDLFIYNGKVGYPGEGRDGIPYWRYWRDGYWKNGGAWTELDEYISQKDLGHIFLRNPNSLPAKITIIDKDNDKENLDKLTAFFDKVIKELGYEDFVTVEVRVEKPR